MKTVRQVTILDIIEKSEIETQEELAEALRLRGIQVTQATVSRDIKELRLLKVLTPMAPISMPLRIKRKTASTTVSSACWLSPCCLWLPQPT